MFRLRMSSNTITISKDLYNLGQTQFSSPRVTPSMDGLWSSEVDSLVLSIFIYTQGMKEAALLTNVT